MVSERLRPFVMMIWAAVLAVVLVCLWQLEQERSTVETAQIDTPAGAVTLNTARGGTPGPLVVVTHGFAGSRQMMQYISRDLARAGFTVASFDFHGQGRSAARMSADVTRIEGTTQQLIEQTQGVTYAVRRHLAYEGPIAFVGHSMATDIIIRAAQAMPDVAAIVAISMYSDAVTATYPQRLLIISGEWEARLRDVGRQLIAQVNTNAREGETVTRGDVSRRAVFVPHTEHVAVLFSARTKREARDWLHSAFGTNSTDHTRGQGMAILGALIGLCILFWPLSRVLPQRTIARHPASLKVFCAAVFLPIVPAGVAAMLAPVSVFDTASFGALTGFFGVWGAVSLVVLGMSGQRFERVSGSAVLVLVIWALGVFAIALDRYGAAFIPFGPRFSLMLVLALGTVPFMLADRVLVAQAYLWQRLLARAVPILALAGCMILLPGDLGLSFTVLPVMVLFYLVFGTMGRAVAQRCGAQTAGWGLGVILAWSIAASTPLFVG